MADQVQLLHEVIIAGGGPTKVVRLLVERRTTQHQTGVPRTFINVVLCIGTKSVFLPRRLVAEIGQALLQVAKSAEAEYVKLLNEQNQETRHG